MMTQLRARMAGSEKSCHLLFVLLLAVGFGLATATPAGAATIYVAKTGSDETGDGSDGNPYLTIQHGFDMAAADDTILVRPGTYIECLDLREFPDKPIQLIAEDWLLNQRNGTTIVDGLTVCGPATLGFRNTVVQLQSSNSRLEGFTIKGAGRSGISTSGNAVITNNIITGNTSFLGGGIYVYNEGCLFGDTVTTITNNDIVDNVVVDNGEGFGGDGGGIYVRLKGLEDDPQSPCTPANPVAIIQNNTIRDNRSSTNDGRTVFGAGLVVFTNTSPLSTATAQISQNTISGNSMNPGVFGYGGGGWITTYGYGQETITFEDNIVRDNHAVLDGGGMSAWIQTLGVDDSNIDHTIHVRNNTFENNNSEGNGGGLDAFVFANDMSAVEAFDMVVDDNLFTGNSALGDFGGGGGLLVSLFAERSKPAVRNFSMAGNVVSDNTSARMGGGIGLLVSSDADPLTNQVPPPDPSETDSLITMDNMLVTGNRTTGASATGGGIFVFLQSFGDAEADVRADRITVADNQTLAGAGGIEIEASTGFDFDFIDEGDALFVLENSIVYGNEGYGVGGAEPGIDEGLMAPALDNEGKLILSFSRSSFFMHPSGHFIDWIIDPLANPVLGNLDTDPLLDPDTYIPTSCSPTVDAGSPSADFGDEPEPNGGRLNMGHTGGTSLATSALAFLDVNGDSKVDGIDVLRIATSFASMNGQPRYLPAADLDGDGDIDGDDLAMVSASFGKTCE